MFTPPPPQKEDYNTPHGPGEACPRGPQHGVPAHLNQCHAIQLFPRTDIKAKPSSYISSFNLSFLFLPNQIKDRLKTGEEQDIGKLCYKIRQEWNKQHERHMGGQEHPTLQPQSREQGALFTLLFSYNKFFIVFPLAHLYPGPPLLPTYPSSNSCSS